MDQNVLSRFFNQPYVQKKSRKRHDFLHVDTNSHEFKFDQKMGVANLVMRP